MDLLIFEPTSTGHHFALYVKQIAQESCVRGVNTTLCTTDAAIRSEQGLSLLAEFSDTLSIYRMPDAVHSQPNANQRSLLINQFRQHYAFRKAYQDLSKTNKKLAIFVPHFAHIEKAVAALGSPFGNDNFSSLCLTPSFIRAGVRPSLSSSFKASIHQTLFSRALKCQSLKTLFITDPVFLKFASRSFPDQVGKLELVNELFASYGFSSVLDFKIDTASKSAANAFTILVAGELTERKGILEILKAAESPVWPSRAKIILAGRLDPSIEQDTVTMRSELRAKGILSEHLGFLPDSQLQSLLRSSDLVWVAYKNFHGMSGMLTQAVVNARPVLAMAFGTIGEITNSRKIGLTIDTHLPETISQSINKFIHDDAFAKGVQESLLQYRTELLTNPSEKVIINRIMEDAYAQQQG